MTTAAAAAPAKKRAAPVWLWTGTSKEGQQRVGEMEAANADIVQARLRAMGINPTKVKKKPISIRLSFGGVPRKNLVIFTRQLATMIDAGLPLVQCLDILHAQQDHAGFKKAIGDVKARVESGSTFADALREHPKVFDELYRELVSAGEVGGILDTILNRLVGYIEKAAKLAGKLKAAMVYPSIVLTVGIGVTVVLMLFVTPTFEKMFKDFGGTLPAPTQIVVDLSRYLRVNGLRIVGLIVVGIFVLMSALRTERGTRIVHTAVLHVPIVGDVVRKTAVARFTRTLGTMVASGVPIMDALAVVAKTSGNKVIEDAILHVRAKVGEGKTIAQPLAETKVFPVMVVQMIGVGEATGALDQMLSKIADFYDEEVDAAVAAMTAAIEPLMMVFLGGVVGGFLIAMYLPIFTIAGAIK